MRSVDGVRRGASRATRRHRGHRRGVFAVTNVDYIIVLSVLFARRDLRFHSLSHRGRSSSAGDAGADYRFGRKAAVPRTARLSRPPLSHRGRGSSAVVIIARYVETKGGTRYRKVRDPGQP
jgi:hypothetical protein